LNLPLAVGAALAVLLVAAGTWFSTTGTTGILEGDDAVEEADAPADDAVDFVVLQGESVSAIAEKLEEAGIIDSALRFRVLAALGEKGDEIKAGDHQLRRGITAAEALRRLTEVVEEETIQLTIPEGWRIEEMADRVQELGIASREEFIAAVSRLDYEFDFLRELPEGTTNLEGYLFPDTYEIAEEATAETVVLLMLQNFDTRVDDDIRAGFAAQGLTIHQAITMASIIEREAVIPEERPTIAGVFYNRLDAGDILGADPTVQYILGGNPESVAAFGYWKVGLTRPDIEIAVSPYNTYLVAGLPPGPIASPGLASIEAVAFPEETDLYYFYACGEEGVHTFSVTAAEHAAAQEACLD
jgi:peptidoglycan lytic transglycosylase G